MKRLIDIPLRTIALAAMSLFLLTIGSFRLPAFVQANPATVSKNTLDPGESTGIQSLAFKNTLLKSFTGLKPFTATASAGGTEVTAHQAALPRLTVSTPGVFLYDDRPSREITLSTSPPTSGLDISFQFIRKSHNGPMTPVAETFLSIRILPQTGTTVTTGADGKAAFRMQAGPGGQGWVNVVASIVNSASQSGTTGSDSSGSDDFNAEIPDPVCECECDCEEDGNDTGPNSVELYSGETELHITDLTIPGRGFHYRFARSFRSQASHLHRTWGGGGGSKRPRISAAITRGL